MYRRQKAHYSDPKVIALQTALSGSDPFCSGICPIPDYQRLLYYTHGDFLHRIDFSNTGENALEDLYRACQPAEFGRNGEDILDESYRKAGKMGLTEFATLFDPRSLGIHEQISKALLTQSLATMNMELYKLNVYGKGDFFKAHKDTPRGRDMFGSLIVVLPTIHEGGQLVLRHGGREWSVHFADKFRTAREPSVCFVACYGDIEHEVLPVTSGYRITLTYNLYHTSAHPTSFIATPLHLELKRALANLVNDKSTLPNGGYMGFGLAHEYVHTGHNLLELLPRQLKGSDRVLADMCDELGLRYSLKLLYRRITDEINLVTADELDVAGQLETEDIGYAEPMPIEYLRDALTGKGLTIEQVEGVNFVGRPYRFDPEDDESDSYSPWLKPFYKNPVTEVLEVTNMKSSVSIKSSFMTYANESEMDFFYGTACMLVAVDPAASRGSVML